MAIREATHDDLNLIDSLTGEHADRDGFSIILAHNNCVTVVQESPASVCTVERDTQTGELWVKYLFPFDGKMVGLYPLLVAANRAASAKWPDRAGYRISALPGDAPEGGPDDDPRARTRYNVCKAWADHFPGAEVVQITRGRAMVWAVTIDRLDRAVGT